VPFQSLKNVILAGFFKNSCLIISFESFLKFQYLRNN
jgi:hypothetical protein